MNMHVQCTEHDTWKHFSNNDKMMTKTCRENWRTKETHTMRKVWSHWPLETKSVLNRLLLENLQEVEIFQKRVQNLVYKMMK